MRRQEKHKLQWRLLFSLLCSTPISLWFNYYRHDFGRAFAALVAGTVFLFVAGEFWGLRKTLSFWAAALMSGAIQILMVLAIPWKLGSHPKGSGLMFVFVVPNLLAVFGAFKLAERIAAKRSSRVDARDQSSAV